MLGHNIWTRFRIRRVVIYAIITTTIFLITAAGSDAAVFSFLDPVKQFLGLQPAQVLVLPERSQLSSQTRPDGLPGRLVDDTAAIGWFEGVVLLTPTPTNTPMTTATNTPSVTPTQCVSPGSLDTSFGSGGKVTTPIGSLVDHASSVAIQTDGRIVAAGYYSTDGSDTDFALARYNTDGSLDTSFGSGGKVTTSIGNGQDWASSVAIQTDGRIVAAGASSDESNRDHFALARYNTDGSLDTSFGSGGKVITSIGNGQDWAYSVTIQTDGRIVAAGISESDTPNGYFALARYNTDGSLDTSFGSGGKVTTPIGSWAYATSVAIQTDGRIVAAGIYWYDESGNGDFALARYNTNGSLDTSFGSGGTVTTPIGSSYDGAASVAIQTDGRIVAAGFSNTGSNDDFALARYNTDGSLDTSFGSGGIVTTPIGSSYDDAESVAIQTDGRIVAAGYSTDGSNHDDFALARYNTDGSLDTSFGSSGTVLTPIGSYTDYANAVAIQMDGRIVAAGISHDESDMPDFALVRYNGAPCSSQTATPTPTNTPAVTPTNTPANTPTNTPTNTATATATATPTNTSTNTPTNTNTPTATSTNTPTNTPTPSLGTYPDTSIPLSSDTTITPSSTPANTTSINVSTSTSFVGELTADPATGVVRVTNAHHANIIPGTYTVTVKAFGPGGTASTTFTLTVTNGTACTGTSGFTSPAVPEVMVGPNPYSVAIGDFNSDGKQDIAVANAGSNNVSIRLGNGSGGFTSPAVPEVAVGSFPFSVAIGDFNGDGKQDFAAANQASTTVSIRLGNGSGGFTSPAVPQVTVGTGPASVAVGDFNGDGRQDFAAANSGSANISIRLGNGIGGFTSPAVPEVAVGSFPFSVAIADFNDDGIQDFATANYNSGNISIRLGNGSGGFTSPVTPEVTAGTNPFSVAIGDFNGDGKQDFAAANEGSTTVSIRLGDGSGGFTTPTLSEVYVGANPISIAIGDFNNDGKQDFAAANYTANVSIRLGNGSGGFTLPAVPEVAAGTNPQAVAIGDFNGDGKQDFATANEGSANVSVRLGSCTATTATPTNTATPTPTAVCTPNVFLNATSITIPDHGPGSPYPSSIVTSGIGGNINKVTVKLIGLYHTYPSDVNVMLVGPGGQNAIIMSDAGDGVALTGITLTLDDDALIYMPDGQLLTGTYKPTDLMPGGTFPAPAPTPAGGSALSTFVGSTPNGTWSLYVMDPWEADSGSFAGGWELSITTSTAGCGATGTPTNTPANTPTATATGTPVVTMPVSLANVNGTTGSVIAVPITVGDLTGLGVIAYDLQVTFDPAVVQPASPAYDKTGTLSSGGGFYTDTTNPGHLIIRVFDGQHFTGSGTLLKLKFNVVGTAGQSTALTFEDYTDPANLVHPGFIFNEGVNPVAATTNGSVTVIRIAISGTVRYGNASPVAPKFVSNVLMSGTGSPPVSAVTGFPDGTYLLSGFGSGAYTVTPSKTGGVNGISSFDAAKIAAHVAGISLLAGNQLVVADVSGNGSINSFDAAQIAQFAVGAGGMHTGHWDFSPVSRTYPSVTTDITGQDYTAMLMGEVSGNWTNTGARPAGKVNSEQWTVNSEDGRAAEKPITVTAQHLVIWTDNEVFVPVIVDGAAGKGIISYEFDLRYDPTVIQPQENPVDLAGTVSRGLSVVTNAKEPGLLRVAVYGPLPIEGNGLLLNLRFTVVGALGSVSPLVLERIMFNEGEPRIIVSDGFVEIF